MQVGSLCALIRNSVAKCLMASALVAVDVFPGRSQTIECLELREKLIGDAEAYWNQAYREKDSIVQCSLFRSAQETYRNLAENDRSCGFTRGAIQADGMARRMREAATRACTQNTESDDDR